MRSLMGTCLLAALAVPGCAAQVYSMARFSGSGSSTASQASVSSGSPLGNAIIVGIMLGDAIRYYHLGPDGGTSVPAPELDSGRKINVQDCTRRVDVSAGNLMCR